ncbi:MAG: C25 family cysteine peptidase [Saprospiraceae bacterium]
MKNLITLLLYCLSVTALLAQSNGESDLEILSFSPTETVLRLQIGGFGETTVATPNGTAIIPRFEGGTPLLVKSVPDVPKYATALAIPNKGNMAVEVIESDFIEVQNITMAPSKGNLLRKVNPADLPFDYGEAYQNNAFFPGKLAEMQTPFIFRETRGQTLWIFPVQYNPVQKSMRVYRSITLRVYHTGGSGTNEQAGGPVTPAQSRVFDQLQRQFFANGSLQAESRGSGGDTPEKMLVIAEDNLLAELEPLVTWKRQMGVHTTVVPVSTIGSSEADAVHEFVKKYYAEHGISYLLLVGDEFAIKPHMRPSGGTSYACDNCFGYMSGDDHFPEILVGRLHANTPAQLRIMVNRNLEYEIDPLTDNNNNWMATAMASASDEGLGVGDDGQADWQHGNEWKSKHLADGYEQYWEFFDGDHTADSPTPGHFTADQPGNPQYSALVNAMNSRGVSLYNYTGHGWEQGLVSGNFTTTAVSTLNNTGRYPILIAVACCAGNFTNGECLGEAWQRAGDYNTGQPRGGIAGFFSSDFQSWSPPMEGQDGMNQYLADADGINISPTMCGMMAFGNAGMIAAYNQGGEAMADFWIPFTDPTTVPRTRYPQTLAAAHPDSTAFGATNLTVACPVEGALVSLYWEGQTWAVARVQNGTATLEFAPLANVADLVVTVTQFNHLPYQSTVRVKPSAQPFVVNQPATIDDSAAGNNNQRADYGELVTLRIPLQNVGLAAATNVQAALATTNPAVTLLDVQANFGNLASNASATALFRFSVRNDVPNGSKVVFDLTATYDGAPANTTKITVPLFAPALTIPSWSLESVTLRANQLYGGEVAVVRILNRNTGGSDLPSATGVLSSLSPYLTVTAPANVGLLSASNGEQLAALDLVVSSATPPGTVAYLKYELQAGAYSVERLIGPFVINAIVETFESNDFKTFNWELPGNFPWTVSTVSPYSGSHCAQSGSIKENQISTMLINLLVEEDGIVSFARRVSSEEGYDFLVFSIDNVVVGSWSGNVPWSEVSFPIGVGQHELRWTYYKDEFVSDGQDRAWVDEILLPKYKTSTGAPAPEEVLFNLAVAPNPTPGMLTVRLDLPSEQAVSIRVHDQLGRLVQTVQPPTRLAAGPFTRSLDLSSFAAGVYLVQVQGEQLGEVVKVVRY